MPVLRLEVMESCPYQFACPSCTCGEAQRTFSGCFRVGCVECSCSEIQKHDRNARAKLNFMSEPVRNAQWRMPLARVMVPPA